MQQSIALAIVRRSQLLRNKCVFACSPRSQLHESVLCPAPTHSRCLASLAEDVYSDDDYGYEDRKGCRSYANIDAWKWKLNVLIRNPLEREIITRDKRDKRDYEYLASLAKRLGLYCQSYGKAVVFSKDPLPNYRPDMDDKRPIRKVSIPLAVHQVVDKLLEEHMERKELFKTKSWKEDAASMEIDGDSWKNLYHKNQLIVSAPAFLQEDLSMQSPSVDDLHKRNIRILDRQRAWQESPSGQEMKAFRKSLPAYRDRYSFLSGVRENQVLVVSGETGCGKTTQLPQYILESEIEAGRGCSCSIICTQPRRISAISVAERVAAERGEQLGESVGYKVRLEGMKGSSTRLLFCTTGILLRRLMSDSHLKGVSHVFVDEIHERGMNEDFLLIVLKDILLHRPDLRVVLMSATLNAKLFSSFFDGAPICNIPGFTYPVKVHFLEDVLELTGHRFTEQNQIDDYGQDRLWKMQKQMQKNKRNPVVSLAEDALINADFRTYSGSTQYSLSQWNPEGLGFNLIEILLCHICKYERDGAILVFMTGWEDINALKDKLKMNPLLGRSSKVILLTCHGAMASSDQRLIFEYPPSKVRKIVLATNLAETSITINDVVFVVDCGKAKETSYDALNNTPCLTPTWISKASARQRRGRAGRVQPGECYHLYPKNVYEAFAEFQQPELLRTPLHSLCLQIKSLKLGTVTDFLSRALQPPDRLSVQNAVELLKTIGAFDSAEELTDLGSHLSMLPVEPRIGKMLIMGCIFSCLDPVLTIAAGLTVKDPFMLPVDKKSIAEESRTKFGKGDCSDHIAIVHAYNGWQDAMDAGNAIDYCWKNFLSFSTLQAMFSLRKQFQGLLREAGFVDSVPEYCNQNSRDFDLLKSIIGAGLFPGISSIWPVEGIKTYKTIEDGPVALYQNSVLSKMEKIPYPWLAFNEKIKTGKILLRDGTGISDSMLLLFGGKLELGQEPGHLHMHEGWLEFSMHPQLADTFLSLRRGLDDLIQRKLENPKLDSLQENRRLFAAVVELLHGDRSEGRFVLAEAIPKKPKRTAVSLIDVKRLLKDRLSKAGYKAPKYKIKGLRNKLFQAIVDVRGKHFKGKTATTKNQAEKNAAAEALEWLDSLVVSKKQQNESDHEQYTSIVK